MSKVDERLRELLHDRAADIPSYWEPPPHLRRRARHRIALTFGGTLLAVTVLAFGAFAGVRSLLRSDGPQPAQFVPKANGQIAFVGRSVTDGNLHLVDPGTGETRILVRGCPPGAEGCAAWIDGKSVSWSPDGTRLAYALNTEGGAGGAAGIYILDVGSGETTRLTSCSDPCFGQSNLDWSPDGTRIAYTQSIDGNCSYATSFDGSCSIFIAGTDGSDPVELRTGSLTDPVDPSWSPDGLHIAFTARQGDRAWSLYTISADGSDVTLLPTGHASRDPVQPAWSPDGSTIAFIRSRAGDYATLWTVASDGSRLTSVADLGCCAGGGSVTDGPYPAWAPDGTKIAVIRGTHLLVLDRDGSELADLGEAWHPPSWQPVPSSGDEPG